MFKKAKKFVKEHKSEIALVGVGCVAYGIGGRVMKMKIFHEGEQKFWRYTPEQHEAISYSHARMAEMKRGMISCLTANITKES